MAIYPEITRRNMRYKGSIETIKYNNSLNEKKINILKNNEYYTNHIKPIVEELNDESKKRVDLKLKLNSLKNKIDFLIRESEID